ncbi:MAG: stage III sporulation protein AC [Clostridia bacterium]|nr:stage III sporulation protein AC [Clostridia bacterium]
MDISLIFRLAGLAVIVTVLYTFFNQAKREEYAYMTVLVGLAIGLLWIIPVLVELFNTIRSVFDFY